MKSKTLLFSVGKKDLIRQTFRAGAKGGQHQNATDSAVRFIHPPSGARGEARDARDQHTNERNAFLRLVKSKEFKAWHQLECAKKLGQTVPETEEEIMARVDTMIEQGLKDGSIVVEEV